MMTLNTGAVFKSCSLGTISRKQSQGAPEAQDFIVDSEIKVALRVLSSRGGSVLFQLKIDPEVLYALFYIGDILSSRSA
jgi:hypothetical protein